MLRSTPEIVVGVDDDAASGHVLLWAARQSQLVGLPLRVVHVWQMANLVAPAATSAAHHYWAAAAGDARARATRWVVHTLSASADCRWTLEVIEGTPGPALVARSAGARLLVLGMGGPARPRRTGLGSVSHYCLSHATAPVVAVPVTAAVPSQLSGRVRETPAQGGATLLPVHMLAT